MLRKLISAIILGLSPGVAFAQDNGLALTDIDWSAVSAGAPVPDPRLDAVNETRLPVLLPPRLLNFRSFTFVGGQLNYTASVRAAGATISVTGTRIASGSEGASPDPQAIAGSGGDQAVISDDLRGVDVGMVRHGAAYLISVECERRNDTRCADERYARGLLDSMEFFGGSRRPPTESPRWPEPPNRASAPLPDFEWRPAGELLAGSGQGVRTTAVHAPNIRFPVERPPAYLNSQVWNVGGSHGPAGGWSDPRNYRYPWRDNFCEARSRATPACPGGRGHQGVDIRPANARNLVHWAVAVEAGRITNIGSYSVTLTGNSGTQYKYLHMRNVRVAVGARVTQGQQLGLVSNNFGGTATTVHLHFEMLQNVGGRGFRHVPPYMSLVRAYERLE